MLGDSGAAAIEVFCDGVQVHGLSGYEAEDLSAGGVGDGLEYVSSCLHVFNCASCPLCVSICLQIYV